VRKEFTLDYRLMGLGRSRGTFCLLRGLKRPERGTCPVPLLCSKAAQAKTMLKKRVHKKKAARKKTNSTAEGVFGN